MNIQSIAYPRQFAQPNANKSNNNSFRYGLTMASPLLKDTVSFQGTPKGANKTWEVNLELAKLVRKRLNESFKQVKKFMDTTFDDLVATEKYPKNPIAEVAYRLKLDTSIKEKTGSRKWRNADEIMENMTDLIGAKIVMRDPNKNKVDAVLDRFVTLIKSGKLELLEIENKRPMVVKGLSGREAAQYDYASLECLNKMIDIQESVWKKAQKGRKAPKVRHNLENDFTDANYCAIHFLFRLPGKNGATFELQLMGNDTNAVKKIDDIVWKKLDGKNPEGLSSEFNELFAPLSDPKFFEAEPNSKEIVEQAKNKFNKYRGELFLFQRNKDALPYSKKKKKEIFLPLQYKLFPTDIELKYNITSSDFDYNNIRDILARKKKVSKQ